MTDTHSSDVAEHYDPGTETYNRRFVEKSDTTPSENVVEVVSEATRTDPCSMEPLYESIDPGSLDSLFESSDHGSHRSQVDHVTFRFEECEVTVDADGVAVVTSPESE